MTLLDAILLVHLVATAYMAGLIWWVQLVHYPLFALVGEETWEAFHRQHVRRAGWAVVPGMLAELATAAVLPFLITDARMLAVIGLLLVATVWFSTFFVQVPLHAKLSRGVDADRVKRLVATNWLRTVVWTARVGIAVALVVIL